MSFEMKTAINCTVSTHPHTARFKADSVSGTAAET